MQSYRLVPVGDKIVLIIEPELQPVSADGGAGYIRMLDAGADCYDFGSEGAMANEGDHDISGWSGGYSHE
jgi:hypothetical protein